jgi:hypothetical protein
LYREIGKYIRIIIKLGPGVETKPGYLMLEKSLEQQGIESTVQECTDLNSFPHPLCSFRC